MKSPTFLSKSVAKPSKKSSAIIIIDVVKSTQSKIESKKYGLESDHVHSQTAVQLADGQK